MSGKYISQLDDSEIAAFADVFEKGAKDSVTVSRDGDGTVLLKIELAPFEDGFGGIVDTYELDDYSVTAYDVALDPEDVFDYRRLMHARFGAEYAEDFLFGVLGFDV